MKKEIREKNFRKLCAEITTCRKCFQLESKMEKYYKFFSGKLDSPLMIVGQSPIYPLPRKIGTPFSLQDDKHQHAGSKWLRDCFNESGIDYMNCYVTNIVKDSPEGNKVTPEMIKNCSPFFEEEMKIFEGRVILALGSAACRYFKVSHGESKQLKNSKYIFGSRHPSYIRRKGDQERKDFIEILKNINSLLSVNKKYKNLDDFN